MPVCWTTPTITLGGLFAALDELGVRDNTLIMVVSDNGASQEGLQHGVTNTDRYRNYDPETVEEMAKHLDEIGSPATDPLIRWAGRWSATRPSRSGNRTPTWAATPTRSSSHGRPRSRTPARSATSTTTWSMSSRPSWKSAGLPVPTSVNGVRRCLCTA